MKRISEEGRPESRELVDAMRTDVADAFVEERVLARIRAGQRRAVSRAWRPVGVLAAVGVLALVSAASAMVWRATHRPAAPIVVPAPPPVLRSPVLPAVVPEPPAPALEAPKPHRTHVEKPTVPVDLPVQAPVVEQPSAPSPEESRILLAAYRAHRQAHDEQEALARVDEYLTRFPHGRLVEEALAIALESTKASPAQARKYARSYLARFPDGTQAELARTLLDQP